MLHPIIGITVILLVILNVSRYIIIISILILITRNYCRIQYFLIGFKFSNTLSRIHVTFKTSVVSFFLDVAYPGSI